MRSWRASGVIVVGAAIAAVSSGASAAPAQKPPPELAVESERAGDSDIYTIDENGQNVQRLTSDRAPDSTPFFFPDGEEIVFASGRDGKFWQLFTMDADGANEDALTDTTGDKFDPVVSPDGTQIAYEGNATGNWDIY